jgi:hypothetical protein
MNSIKYPEPLTFVHIHIKDDDRAYTVLGFWDRHHWYSVGISNLSEVFSNKIAPSIVVGWSEVKA